MENRTLFSIFRPLLTLSSVSYDWDYWAAKCKPLWERSIWQVRPKSHAAWLNLLRRPLNKEKKMSYWVKWDCSWISHKARNHATVTDIVNKSSSQSQRHPMKLQCLDRQNSSQNCFLIKLRQLTILVNCPLEISSLFPTDQDQNEDLQDAQTQVSDFAAVLSSYIERRKLLMENLVNQSSLVNEPTCIFRIPDLSLVDVNAIDCVLLTSSKHMLGLPFLTEYLGYKGRILATESSIEFAR